MLTPKVSFRGQPQLDESTLAFDYCFGPTEVSIPSLLPCPVCIGRHFFPPFLPVLVSACRERERERESARVFNEQLCLI